MISTLQATIEWINTAGALQRGLCLAILLLLAPGALFAQDSRTDHIPANVQELLGLLAKSDVQEWLRARESADKATEPTAQVVNEAEFSHAFSDRLASIRGHLWDLWSAIPRIWPEIRAASSRIFTSTGENNLATVSGIAALLAGLGYISRLLVLKLLAGALQSDGVVNSKPQVARLQQTGTLIVHALAGLLAFFAASIGPLLIFGNPQLDAVALGIILPFAGWVVVRAAADLGSSILRDGRAPAAETVKTRSTHLISAIVTAAAWFAVSFTVIWATRMLGMSGMASQLVAYILGAGLLTFGISAVWRLPPKPAETNKTTRGFSFSRWTASLVLLVLWLLWVAGAMRLFWLLAIGLSLPLALRGARKLTVYLFQDFDEPAGKPDTVSVAVIVDMVLQAVIIGTSLSILAVAWDISLAHLTTSDNAIAVVLRALLAAIAIVFAFTVLWRFTSIAIDLKLARVSKQSQQEAGTEQARLRTLLPVLRNGAMVVFTTLAVLMALSALGVQIGPLVASAGVVGLAVGFGAQTVVKDVISGFFYLLDDAFRVGEYIVSGNYSGTVESFSLRSVRLRHHRGAIFTVPFSVLGAVQNGSRDFSVDKLLVTVTYDTDLEKARKLIKKVGEQLKLDPELESAFIEPLKMQGVADFGAYGIQLKIKATVKPGYQPMLRKKAFPLIKQAFQENGVEFAHPTVKVSDSDQASRAAAFQQISTNDMSKASGPSA